MDGFGCALTNRYLCYCDCSYNNFFCYATVQQASFGADSGNLNDGGSSWFILGAGETLTCEMQYGELAWPMVSVIAMEGSIFPSSAAAPVAVEKAPSAGVGAPRSRRLLVKLQRLWREWCTFHNKPQLREGSQRFENFIRAVALADAQQKGFVGARFC